MVFGSGSGSNLLGDGVAVGLSWKWTRFPAEVVLRKVCQMFEVTAGENYFPTACYVRFFWLQATGEDESHCVSGCMVGLTSACQWVSLWKREEM